MSYTEQQQLFKTFQNFQNCGVFTRRISYVQNPKYVNLTVSHRNDDLGNSLNYTADLLQDCLKMRVSELFQLFKKLFIDNFSSVTV